MREIPHQNATIVVVDPCPADYLPLRLAEKRKRTLFHFITSGQSALDRHIWSDLHLCVINVDLPDMSGLDLYGLLRPHLVDIPVFLAADEYHSDVEIAVLRIGAVHYLTKPILPSLVDKLREGRFSSRQSQRNEPALASETVQ